MKITLAFTALVALVATAASAAPANSTASNSIVRPLEVPCRSITLYWRRDLQPPSYAFDPPNDLHSFHLIVNDRYNGWINAKATSGKKSNNYKETRTSSDKLWSVTHTSRTIDGIVLKVKGKNYPFVWHGDPEKGGHFEGHTFVDEYWHCVDWDK
ncbi:hypothetical protein BGW39_007994 [Mortierella sp. 14UC]|nr:hypothetical protein BGW39_007994 [Mortierella sp. 14UC]